MRAVYRFWGFVFAVLILALSAFGMYSGTQAAATKTPTPPPASAAVGTLAVAIYDNSTRTNVLYLVNTDGKNLKQLDVPITPFTYKRLIAWSPDGTHLAFVDKDYQVTVVNPDGSNPQPIAKSRQIFAWTPDSQQITFETTNGQIVNADLATGTQQPVVTLKENEGEHIDTLAWSSDGKRLLYVIAGSTGSKLHVIDIASSVDQALTTTVPPDGALWNPVADQPNKLAYFGVGNGKGGIFTYDLTSKKITALFSSYLFVSHVDWSPDGKQIVYDTNGGLAVIDVTSHKMRRLPLPDTLLNKEIEGISWRPTPTASAPATASATVAATS